MSDQNKFSDHLKCVADHCATGFDTPDGSNYGLTKREVMAIQIFCSLINRTNLAIPLDLDESKDGLISLANYSVEASHVLIQALNEY